MPQIILNNNQKVSGAKGPICDLGVRNLSNFKVEQTGIALPYSYTGNDTAHLSRAGIECCLFGPRGDAKDAEKHVLISEMTACARTLAALAILRCTWPNSIHSVNLNARTDWWNKSGALSHDF